MKKKVLATVLSFVLFSFWSIQLVASTPSEKGLQIATQMRDSNEGIIGEESEMEMILIDAFGTKVSRKMRGKSKEMPNDGDKSLSEFLTPADVKGTKLLTHSHKEDEDDQWLYLPSLKRKKRISGGSKSSSFMGSEFSYEDLGSQEIEKYNFLWIKDENIEGEDVWVLERKSKKRSGYSKQVMYVSKRYLAPVKVEYFDRRQELLKTAVFSDWSQTKVKKKNFWRSAKVHMKNHQTKKESIFSWSKRNFGVNHSDQVFAPGRLR